MDTLPSKKKKRRTGLVVGMLAFLGLGGVAAAAAAGGGGDKKKPDPKPEPKPDPKPEPKPEPKPDPKPEPEPEPEPEPDAPPPPKPGESLVFDLSQNWGATPLELRKHLARMELASGIPGSARAAAVKMWQAFRAGKALVGPAEAAAIAANNPDLCRTCFNPGDGPDAKAGIAAGLAKSWPEPKDKAGWESGSFGLGDILGSTGVWTGIEDAKVAAKTYSRALLPLIDLPAKQAMARYDVQVWVIGVQIWQFLSGVNYKVLVPGQGVTNGDSYNTWGNIFSAYAAPAQYVQGQGLGAKTRYLERATELGIDLSKVAFPWPPGKSYKFPTAFSPVKKFWSTLQDYMKRDVVDVGANAIEPPPLPPDPAPNPPAPNPMPLLLMLPGGLAARMQPSPVAAGESAPMVLVLHGRDGSEQQVASLVPGDVKARVFVLRGNIKTSEGYRYFDANLSDADASDAIAGATQTLITGLQHLLGKYPTTRILAVGYSQGAALALRLAAIGAADGAVSVAGILPAGSLPQWPTQARVSLIHGGKDARVPPAKAQATYQGFTAAGFFAQLHTFDDAGHALTSDMTAAAALAVPSLLSEILAPDQQGWHWTESCELVIDDVPSMERAAIPAIVDAADNYKHAISDTILGDLVRSVLAADDPSCLLGSLDPISAEHARNLYLFARATLQTLVLRGRLPKATALQFLQDSKQSAMKKGATAAMLPPMEV